MALPRERSRSHRAVRELVGCRGSSDTRTPARTRGAPILPAGYEGYSKGSWHQLAAASPQTAGYITLVFRMYGIYIVAFGLLAVTIAATAFRPGDRWAWWALLAGNTVAFVSAMTYDRIVGAIGPFEWSEYLGLAVIYASLAVTAPALTGARAVRQSPGRFVERVRLEAARAGLEAGDDTLDVVAERCGLGSAKSCGAYSTTIWGQS